MPENHHFTPYSLTPADIVDLRVEMKRRGGFIADGDRTGFAFVACARSEPEFYLHSGGATVAVSRNPAVILACLRNEAISPGWCRHAFDPLHDPSEVLMDPAEQQAREHRRRVAATLQRQHEEEAAEAARRRRTHLRAPEINPEDVDLDFLMDPTR